MKKKDSFEGREAGDVNDTKTPTSEIHSSPEASRERRETRPRAGNPEREAMGIMVFPSWQDSKVS